MSRLKIVFILLIASFCDACYSQDYQCNQKEGNLSYSDDDLDAAFDHLKNCENVDNVTGLTLGQLAMLYSYFGYGEFEDGENRARKTYDLIVRSALKGNEQAMLTVLDIIEDGEPLISLKPQKEKAVCLKALLDKDLRKYKPKHVAACLDK